MYNNGNKCEKIVCGSCIVYVEGNSCLVPFVVEYFRMLLITRDRMFVNYDVSLSIPKSCGLVNLGCICVYDSCFLSRIKIQSI